MRRTGQSRALDRNDDSRPRLSIAGDLLILQLARRLKSRLRRCGGNDLSVQSGSWRQWLFTLPPAELTGHRHCRIIQVIPEILNRLVSVAG